MQACRPAGQHVAAVRCCPAGRQAPRFYTSELSIRRVLANCLLSKVTILMNNAPYRRGIRRYLAGSGKTILQKLWLLLYERRVEKFFHRVFKTSANPMVISQLMLVCNFYKSCQIRLYCFFVVAFFSYHSFRSYRSDTYTAFSRINFQANFAPTTAPGYTPLATLIVPHRSNDGRSIPL